MGWIFEVFVDSRFFFDNCDVIELRFVLIGSRIWWLWLFDGWFFDKFFLEMVNVFFWSWILIFFGLKFLKFNLGLNLRFFIFFFEYFIFLIMRMLLWFVLCEVIVVGLVFLGSLKKCLNLLVMNLYFFLNRCNLCKVIFLLLILSEILCSL